ncbi:hypothetical protein R5W23_005474 [Gemmata sp. JC673]|uniref:SMI1/KNR4 family protein n=1 Tax=Gemmata algarum TaxID=2975278 RepID=A0ABU5ESS0_9BACT|nr:hypothetical protein [Gemmata algarum]MDY3558381.1 hypothetical protein [Gemmata algarum]
MSTAQTPAGWQSIRELGQFRAVLDSPKRGALVWLAVEYIARIHSLLIPDGMSLAEVVEGCAEGRLDRAAVLDAFRVFQQAHYTPRIVRAQDSDSLIDIGAYDSHSSEAVAAAAYLVVGDLIDSDDERFHSTREQFWLVLGVAECCRHAVMATIPDVPWREEELPPELESSRAAFLKLSPAQFRELRRMPELNPTLHAVWQALDEASSRREARRNAAWEAEEVVQCDLVREVVAPPLVTGITPPLRTSTVLSLARGIYEHRAFDRMPILADSLQDAGCEDVDVLDHCRGPGPHVRGCWVVDLVLGKE